MTPHIVVTTWPIQSYSLGSAVKTATQCIITRERRCITNEQLGHSLLKNDSVALTNNQETTWYMLLLTTTYICVQWDIYFPWDTAQSWPLEIPCYDYGQYSIHIRKMLRVVFTPIYYQESQMICFQKNCKLLMSWSLKMLHRMPITLQTINRHLYMTTATPEILLTFSSKGDNKWSIQMLPISLHLVMA